MKRQSIARIGAELKRRRAAKISTKWMAIIKDNTPETGVYRKDGKNHELY